MALAVHSSAVEQVQTGDADYATQIKELEVKRKNAIDVLIKGVRNLEEELDKIEEIKTNNPFKKIALDQKQAELRQKIDVAKDRWTLAEKSSNAEMEKLQEEYKKKKQATTIKIQSLEQEIQTKAIDQTTDARKAATNALANSVKSLVQRQTAPPQPPTT